MALDFIALQTEFYARGFDYLNDGAGGATRAKRWINDAMHRINDTRPWTYLNQTATGAAPLAITALGRIERVLIAGVTGPLTFMPRAGLSDMFGDLTVAGTAVYYYLTGSGATTTVNVYPVSTAVLTVNYYKIDTDLSANGDAPSMPDRFREAIVDFAVEAALKDKSNYVEALSAAQAAKERVQQMIEWDVLLAGDGGRQVIVGASDDW